MPTDATTMNYNSVILAGVVFLTALWWVLHAIKHYPGPKVMTLYIHEDQQQLDSVPVMDAAEDTSEKKKA